MLDNLTRFLPYAHNVTPLYFSDLRVCEGFELAYERLKRLKCITPAVVCQVDRCQNADPSVIDNKLNESTKLKGRKFWPLSIIKALIRACRSIVTTVGPTNPSSYAFAVKVLCKRSHL